MNTKARTRGVRHGMTRVEVETISSVISLARTLHEEAQARMIVQEVAGSFTPRIENGVQLWGPGWDELSRLPWRSLFAFWRKSEFSRLLLDRLVAFYCQALSR